MMTDKESKDKKNRGGIGIKDVDKGLDPSLLHKQGLFMEEADLKVLQESILSTITTALRIATREMVRPPLSF